MNLNLDGKIIIVTGGAKGIGEGIVKVLAEENAIPVIIGRKEADNLKTIESIGGKGFQVVAELTKPDECEKAIQKIIEKYGRIDGLVNNAGLNDGVGLENGNYEKFIASLHNSLVHYYLIGASRVAVFKTITWSDRKHRFKNCRNRAGKYFRVCSI